MTESCSGKIKYEGREWWPQASISPAAAEWAEQAAGSCVGQEVLVPCESGSLGSCASNPQWLQPELLTPGLLASLLIKLQTQGNDLKIRKGSSQGRHKGLFDLFLKGE